MAGFQPLVIEAGQIRNVGISRTEVLRLNIGPSTPINVTGPSFTITRSCHLMSNLTGADIEVFDIFGGVEGDVIVLFSGAVPKKLKLKMGGTIDLKKDFEFKENRSITLYFDGSIWKPISLFQQ